MGFSEPLLNVATVAEEFLDVSECPAHVEDLMAKRKPNWRRMGEAARLRRGELGLTQPELIERMADHHAVGIETLRRVEAGDQGTYRSPTLAAVSVALDWPADRLWSIAHGSPPPDIDSRVAAVEAQIVVIDERLERIEAKVEDLVSRPRRAAGR